MTKVTWPPRLHIYMVKHPSKSSSPEQVVRFPRDLVCNIRDSGPSQFVQMMILGWTCPILRRGQIWSCVCLNWFNFYTASIWQNHTIKRRFINISYCIVNSQHVRKRSNPVKPFSNLHFFLHFYLSVVQHRCCICSNCVLVIIINFIIIVHTGDTSESM